jgi:hypothetical protein
MLFLLRQIRRKTAMNNKFTTYFLYAIGEIFLVVVGILIAVSIDDFNSSIKRAESELEVLKSIQAGLEQV